MAGLSKGSVAALIAAAAGALCLLLESSVPWLVKFPAAWVLPATDWVGAGLEWFLALIKPTARAFSALMFYPMEAANFVLSSTPWPLVICATTALAWILGGVRMALMAVVGLGFVLASGYWPESMNTLALVAVSVPLALIIGGGIGILANEYPRIRQPVQAVLDIMQTVPTFAYLTPLLVLFGFGPVVGLIASAIYAAPPMARNVLLGLERVEPEIKEAAIMAGGTRLQQLF
ncbi:ABC transporter permease subunit, partial [Leisingera sp. ANG-Vp]|uniref:ABC transporter permease subunit n=1 Tax=Leisingera sp. ANG-Vp TaxID=1577896 RepID=UPI00057F7F60